MNQAIAAFTTTVILASFASAAYAQSAPEGSAASLEGVQSISVQNAPAKAKTELESPTSTRTTNSERKLTELLGISDRLEIRTGPTVNNNESNVYPDDRPTNDAGVRVLYRLDQ
jgi:Skp family chaperone for outer membrane proteins